MFNIDLNDKKIHGIEKIDMENEKENKKAEEINENLISRKDAIRKASYVALSAATMMLLLNKPDKAVAASAPAPPPGW